MPLIKVSDYIVRFLADRGVRHVFMLTGGGAMHLNDSFGNEPRIRVICSHHEQACAMGAEAYARIHGDLGVINVTTGPGGINAMNGVFGAWADSIPMLIVSGQVKRELCTSSRGIQGLRQLGDQEADVVSMVRGITKYAVMVTKPSDIRYHLERAVHLATSGRPGPCWVDVPIDVQASQVDPAALSGYDPAENAVPDDSARLPQLCADVLSRLESAERPVLLVGKGIRAAGALDQFESLIRSLRIPVATGWQGIDLLPSDDTLFCGRPGDLGDRPGNFTVQNSDLLLIVGCRLSIRHTSHNYQAFARHAFKIQVDIDPSELRKPTVRIDLPIHSDARSFLDETLRQLLQRGFDSDRHSNWLTWCKERVQRYPVVLPRHRVVKDGGLVNPYWFVETLFNHLAPDDIVACGNGAANVVGFQAAYIRKGQRVFANTGDASMGYDLPAAIGAAIAREGGRVVCLAGDGSIQLNMQELQTVVHHALPVKILVLNNGGYLSIRMSQGAYFGRFVGESPRSGVSLPDMVKVAEAYGVPARRISGSDFEQQLVEALEAPGPALCEVMLDPEQQFEPKLSSRQLPDGRMVSAPLEDMFPFLDREELQQNLLVPPMEA